MLPTSHRNFSQEKSLIIASPHTVYSSLGENQEIKNLLSKATIDTSLNDSRLSLISVKDSDVVSNHSISSAELYEIEALFYLFVRDLLHPFKIVTTSEYKLPYNYMRCSKKDFTQELNEFLRQDVQPVEEAILASLFLERDQIPYDLRYIYDLMHGIMYYPINLVEHSQVNDPNQQSRLIPSKHWKIPLSGSLIKEKVSFLDLKTDLEIDTITVEDLKTLETKSYYHINKNELMERVRYLLSKGLFDDREVSTYENVRELYDKLLNYKEVIMWETASNQFPENEVIFLWNRSMISQSIWRAWHINSMIGRLENSIPNFKVIHHRKVRYGDRLIPIIDAEVWTNDQLKDVLGHDWMFDQNLTLEDNWMSIKKETDLHIVREMLLQVISLNSSTITMTIKEGDIDQRKFIVQTQNNQSIMIIRGESVNQGSLWVRTNNGKSLYLEEFNPEEIPFPNKGSRISHQSLLNVDHDEKELVMQDSNEQVRVIPDFFLYDSRSIDSFNLSAYVPIELQDPMEDTYDQSRNKDDEMIENDSDSCDDQVL